MDLTKYDDRNKGKTSKRPKMPENVTKNLLGKCCQKVSKMAENGDKDECFLWAKSNVCILLPLSRFYKERAYSFRSSSYESPIPNDQ